MEIANDNLSKLSKSSGGAELLGTRHVVVLALIAVFHALLLCWAMAAPGTLPLAGAASVRMLPYLTIALAASLAALTAPVLMDADSAPGLNLGRALFAALWQGGAFGFFLMLDARLTSLNTGGMLRAAVWLSLVALCCLLLANVLRRAYMGLVFFWICALPVGIYLLAELFMISPAGSSGWTQASGPQAQAIRAFVSQMLSLSPATGAAGALSGVLPDGSPYAAGWPMAVLAVIDVVLGGFVLKVKTREAAQVPELSVERA